MYVLPCYLKLYYGDSYLSLSLLLVRKPPIGITEERVSLIILLLSLVLRYCIYFKKL